jgi:sugar lactone lactonase YvrE
VNGRLEQLTPRTEGFRTNYSFVRDRAGNMYWFNPGPPPAVVRRAPDGRTTRLAENAGYRNVRWMTAAPDGTVYFTDDGDLRRLAPDGTITTLARNLREQSAMPWYMRLFSLALGDQHNLMGVWVDAQGRVYVAVAGGGMVKRVDAQGRVEIVARSREPWIPTGGLVAPNGDLWLLEYSRTNAARARRISREGREQVY